MNQAETVKEDRIRRIGDQRGITGLETAIVLIAFVVVASVFAFAVLSTGLLSSEKSKETVLGGLEETGATIAIKGSVIAHTDATNVNYITFQVANASQTGEAVALTDDDTIVSYIDADQVEGDLPYRAVAPTTTTEAWGPTWISGSGPLLNPGERVEITVNLTQLSTRLPVSKEFTIEVKPAQGATLIVNRTTPAELTTVVDLQ